MSDALDDVIRSARRHTERDPIRDSGRDAALVRHAVLAGRGRHRSDQRRRVLGWAAGVTALAASVALVIGLRGGSTSGDYEMSLPTGDRLLANAEVRFEIVSEAPALRRIRLHEGAMLFDVAPLGETGAAFEVVTDDETVRVEGTVFVVEATERGTAVEVYEGRVQVIPRTGEARVLERGGRHGAAFASHRSAALGAPAAAAAAFRDARASASSVTSLEPATSTPPAVESVATPPPVSPSPLELAPAVPEERARPRLTAPPPIEPDVVAPAEALPLDVAAEVPPVDRTREAPLDATGEPLPSDGASEALARRAASAVTAGDPERALAMVRAEGGADPSPALLVVEADALRALRRFRSAAEAYERVARHPRASDRAPLAGFIAAELWARRFGEHARARRALSSSGALESAALRELALALDAEVAVALGDVAGLEADARAYLVEFPDGHRAAWMRAHAEH